jgi:acyl carrier protein
VITDVQETVAQLIQRKTGREPQNGDSLATLEIDSLAMAELTVELEQTFGVRVEEDILDVQTLQELSEYVDRKIAASRELA